MIVLLTNELSRRRVIMKDSSLHSFKAKDTSSLLSFFDDDYFYELTNIYKMIYRNANGIKEPSSRERLQLKNRSTVTNFVRDYV